MATYDLGDGVPLEHTVRNADGVLTNATVALALTRPDGTVFTPPAITNVSTGVYRAIPVPDAVGPWVGAWTTSGAVVSVTPLGFAVADPAPQSYCSLGTVKMMLGKFTDDDRDELVAAAIESGARLIDEQCGRSFYIDETATSRTYSAAARSGWIDGERVLFVDDIATDTVTVEVWNGGTWTAVTDLYLGPDNAPVRGRPYTQIHFPNGISGSRIRITTRWGWPAFPAQVVQANGLLASRIYRRKDSPNGVIGNADWGAIRVSRTDPDVEALLRPFVIPLIR